MLDDAVAIAADYDRTPRDFDVDGPHVVTGPVYVEGAEPGDVLKVETLEAIPRVPYGVVSSRHGKGALARHGRRHPAGGHHPRRGHAAGRRPTAARPATPTRYGNVSVFTAGRAATRACMTSAGGTSARVGAVPAATRSWG